MDINKMTDTLEPEETGVGGLQLPGKHQFIFRPSERVAIRIIHFQFHLRTPKDSSVMASIGEDMENPHSLIKMTLERVTPSSRNSRSGDHRCSRRDSPEYDRREGRVVSRYIVMIGIIETIQNHHLVMDETTKTDNKRSRYESSRRTPGIAHLQIGGYFGRNNV
ncbi:hypothetical protein Tco_1318467 [Tanacetum coccineum]